MANLKPFISVRLVERTAFSGERERFIFEPERPVGFKPGQYATLAVVHADDLIQRAYSIVSSPHEPTLEFFIELVEHGELTPRMITVGLVLVLGQDSPLEALFRAIQGYYGRFTFALSMP